MIKIRGQHTQSIDISVSPRDIHDAFLTHFINSTFPDPKHSPTPPSVRHRTRYINSEGYWEQWEDGHGSGFTETLRKATDEEVKLMEVYRMLEEMRKLF